MILFKKKAGGIWGFNTFPKDICPKVNVLLWLEFELAYFETVVQHFSHYALIQWDISAFFHFCLIYVTINYSQSIYLSPALVAKVFTYGPRDQVSIQGRVIPKT